MKKHLSGILFIIICICLVPAAALPCTTFVLDNNGQAVYGKNFDYYHVPCFVIVNKRGVAKTSMPVRQELDAKQISWTSKYGSVTFNFFSREMPFEGINEAGLFVSTMAVSADNEIEALPQDSRASINAYQWVQYQLDNFSTVDEVIASDKKIRGGGTNFAKAHFIAGDSRGNCSSIELIDGKMVYHTGENLPYKALTNNTYDKSLHYIDLYRGYGGVLPVKLSRVLIKSAANPYRNSLPRFVCAADMIQKFDSQASGPAVDYAFDILTIAAQPKFSFATTQWSAVYDSGNRQIYFRSSSNKLIRSFNLNAFDFSCTAPVKVLDIRAGLSGDVSNNFVDYTKDIDLVMLKGVVLLGGGKLSDEDISYYAAYPDYSTACTE